MVEILLPSCVILIMETPDLKNSKRYSDLFKKLVPEEGSSSTEEGEMLRAISKIGYRYSNDGDYFYRGYGCETAGPAHAYLVKYSPLKEELKVILAKADGQVDDAYEAIIDQALEVIVTYIEGREAYSPNSLDMLECDSLYEEDDYEEDDYEEDDYEEDDDEEDDDR